MCRDASGNYLSREIEAIRTDKGNLPECTRERDKRLWQQVNSYITQWFDSLGMTLNIKELQETLKEEHAM